MCQLGEGFQQEEFRLDWEENTPKLTFPCIFQVRIGC